MKKSVKTIIIMLCIILTCGGILAILSNLLYVSDDERIERAIAKIYKEEQVSLSETIDLTDYVPEDDKGEIKACYVLDNGDYLVLSKGKKGYSNGSVTLYVAINASGTVKKVVQDSYTGQTLMSKLSGWYDSFIGENPSDVEPVSGATYSSTASINAVTVATNFVNGIGG